MNNFNLIMVTTHQDDVHILKLIDSISDNIVKTNVLLLVVSQECEMNYVSQSPFLSIIFINELKMGLSKARNIALKYLLDNILSAEYIMFPDDDSSFDSVFFDNFSSILGSNKCYITPIYNEGTNDLYLGRRTPNGQSITPSNHQLIGSPNQIILYDKLSDKIFFNEELGVGALYGSSEDLDVFIKLFNSGEQFTFINNIYSYHPKKVAAYKQATFKKIIIRFKSYSTGFAYVIFKYRLFSLVPEYLARTFGGFVVFLSKLQFRLAVAYFFKFFIRVKILFIFLFNKNLYK
jgi:hypothetical protein